MSDIINTASNFMKLAFSCIPQNWFVIVLPAAAIVGLITAVRRL